MLLSRKQHLTPHIVVLAAYFSLGLMFITGVLLSLTRTSADFGHLLFTEYDSDRDYKPFFYDWKTGNRQLLPAETVSDSMPSWAVDDSHIFIQSCFVTQYQICSESDFIIFPKVDLAKPDALKPRLGKNEGNGFLWSPDGQFVLFGQYRDTSIMKADGSDVHNLFPGSGPDGYPLIWSPDSQHIAFVDQNNQANILNLTDNRVYPIANHHLNVSRLTWSPDSRQLVFALIINPTSDASELYVVDADGANLTNLSNGVLRYYQQIVWSPDNLQLALATRQGIYLLNRDGTDLRLLTRKYISGEIVWSPDSRQLAFYSRDSSEQNQVYLYMIDADGHNLPVRLISNNTYDDDTLFPSLFWLNQEFSG